MRQHRTPPRLSPHQAKDQQRKGRRLTSASPTPTTERRKTGLGTVLRNTYRRVLQPKRPHAWQPPNSTAGSRTGTTACPPQSLFEQTYARAKASLLAPPSETLPIGEGALPALLTHIDTTTTHPPTFHTSPDFFLPPEGQKGLAYAGLLQGFEPAKEGKADAGALIIIGTRIRHQPPVPFAIFMLAEHSTSRQGEQKQASLAIGERLLEAMWGREADDQDAIVSLLTKTIRGRERSILEPGGQGFALALVLDKSVYLSRQGGISHTLSSLSGDLPLEFRCPDTSPDDSGANGPLVDVVALPHRVNLLLTMGTSQTPGALSFSRPQTREGGKERAPRRALAIRIYTPSPPEP